MTILRSRLAVLPLLLVFSACGKEAKDGERVQALAAGLFSAIRASDETAFVKAHVQADDMSPSGGYWLATKAGGVRPDEAWDRQVRDAFASLQSELKAMGIDPSALVFVDAAGADVALVQEDKDRQNLQNLRIRMKSGDTSYVFVFSEGMLSQRGWVLTGDPVVKVERDAAR